MKEKQGLTELPVPDQLMSLDAVIVQAMERSWSSLSFPEQLEQIATAVASLCERFGQVGESAYAQLSGDGSFSEEERFY